MILAKASQKYLNEAFIYDNGTLIRNPDRPSSHFHSEGHYQYYLKTLAGTPAEIKGSGGYNVVSFMRGNVVAHRVIWKMHYGTVPRYIDHINRVKTDNRIENLRQVTAKENSDNRFDYWGGFCMDDLEKYVKQSPDIYVSNPDSILLTKFILRHEEDILSGNGDFGDLKPALESVKLIMEQRKDDK